MKHRNNFMLRKMTTRSKWIMLGRGAAVGLCLSFVLGIGVTSAAPPAIPVQLLTTGAFGIAINNSGTLAFTNSAGDVLTTTPNGTVTTVAQAQNLGGPLSAPRINDSGQVAFVIGGGPFFSGKGVALNTNGVTTVLANTSTASPSGGTFLSFPNNFANIGLNGSGQVAFPARAANGGTFLASGGSLSSAAVAGDALAGHGNVSNFCGLAGIDGAGTVISTIEASDGAQAIVASTGSTDQVLVASGDPAPGGGTFTSLGCATVLANTTHQPSGSVLFMASVTSGTGSTQAIFAAAGGQLFRVASVGDNLSQGAGKIQSFSSSSLTVNDNCQIAFKATVKKGSQTYGALIIGSANGLRQVVAEGDTSPDGGIFVEVAGADVPIAFSNGYLAFRGSTSTGTQGVFLAMPAVVPSCGGL